MIDDDALLAGVLGEFLAEAAELLAVVDAGLTALGQSPDEARHFTEMCRALHTLRGAAAWLGFPRLEALARAGESLMAKLRDEERACDEVALGGLRRMTHRMREALGTIAVQGREGEQDDRELVSTLDVLAAVVVGSSERMVLIRVAGSRLAVPLGSVDGLEVFDPASIERRAGRASVRYREEVLPLVRVADVLEERRKRPRPSTADPLANERAGVHVVVQSIEGLRFGLVVDRIEDAIADHVSIRGVEGRGGVLGKAVIGGSLTEVFDVHAAYRLLDASLAGPSSLG